MQQSDVHFVLSVATGSRRVNVEHRVFVTMTFITVAYFIADASFMEWITTSKTTAIFERCLNVPNLN